MAPCCARAQAVKRVLAELQDLQNRLAALDVVVKLVSAFMHLLRLLAGFGGAFRRPAMHACAHALASTHSSAVRPHAHHLLGS